MKKLTFILLAVVGSMAFVNCSSDDDKGGILNCEELITNASNAAMAYSNNPSVENCIAFQNALDALVDSDCPGAGIYDDEDYDLDCQ